MSYKPVYRRRPVRSSAQTRILLVLAFTIGATPAGLRQLASAQPNERTGTTPVQQQTSDKRAEPAPREEAISTSIGALLQTNPALVAQAKRAIYTASEVEEEVRRDLAQEAQESLVHGDYDELARIFGQLSDTPGADPAVHLWHGHGHQLQGDFARAARAYRDALRAIEQHLQRLEEQFDANNVGLQRLGSKGNQERRRYELSRRQQQLRTEWPQVVLLVGLLELQELQNPAAAAEALSTGLRHSVLADQSLAQLAEDAQRRLSGEDPELPREAWRDLMYPVATQRYLALAHERLGNTQVAVDAWTRVRLVAIAYDVPLARTDAAHLRMLFEGLEDESLEPWHRLVLENLGPDDRATRRELDLRSGELARLLARAENPFKVVPLDKLRLMEAGPPAPAASIVRLPDGKFLAAYTAGGWEQARILLSASDDGRAWSDPWLFSHNSIFDTRGPSLIIDDAGTIWLVCLSKRLDADRFSSAGYYLWICHSRNGSTWSPLRPILTDVSAQYQFTTQLTRSPDGRFWLFYNGYAASGESPAEIRGLEKLGLPVSDKQFPTNTHAAFAADGRCHLVFDDFGRAIYYTRSDDLKSWSPLQLLAEREEGSSTEFPRMILGGSAATVLFDTNQGLWMRQGHIAPERPLLDLGQPLQCTTQVLRIQGADCLTSDGTLYLIAGNGSYAGLLKADLAELLETAPRRPGGR